MHDFLVIINIEGPSSQSIENESLSQALTRCRSPSKGEEVMNAGLPFSQ
jgi:hypothetical protein